MRLLVIRHAPAEDRDEFAKTGKDDSERPLTDDGKAQMRRAARPTQESSLAVSVGCIANGTRVGSKRAQRSIDVTFAVSQTLLNRCSSQTTREASRGPCLESECARFPGIGCGRCTCRRNHAWRVLISAVQR